MLTVYILTPFPNIIEPILNESMLRKSVERNKVKFIIINLFDFLDDKENRLDDYPFGGSKGMIMKAEPILNAFNSIKNKPDRIVFPTPDGKLLNHKISKELSEQKSLFFICGHYKGIDQRIREEIVTDEISIGDYVLTNGELASLVIIDSVVRLIPGVLNHYESAEKDSFFDDLLDGPHYTRPRKIGDLSVPEILLSGNHKKIEEWFLKKRINKTKKRRKDLFVKYKIKEGKKNE